MYYVPYRYEVDVAVQYYHDGAADERSSSTLEAAAKSFTFQFNCCLARQFSSLHFTSLHFICRARTRKKEGATCVCEHDGIRVRARHEASHRVDGFRVATA